MAEAKPIIAHGHAPGCEADALAVDTVDDVALCSCVVRQSRIRCDARSCLVELAPAERFEQVAGKDDTLALTTRESFAGQIFHTSLHPVVDLSAESAGAQGYRMAGDTRRVGPCGAGRLNLGRDRQVGPNRKRYTLPARRILEPAQLD